MGSLRYLSWTIWQIPMLCFWDFTIKYVKFKREKVEETQFCKYFGREIEFSSNKNKVSSQVKVDILQC